MATKMLALIAFLAVSVSASTAFQYPQYYPQYSALSVPCVQYATLQQVLASGISPSSATILQRPLAFLRQQCWTHLLLQGIASLPQQQASSIVQQQIIQQQLLPILLRQAQPQQMQQQQVWSIVQQQILQQQLLPILLQQVQQQQQVLPILLQQVQQQVILPYLFNIMATANPAAMNPMAALNPVIYGQQQLLPFMVNALAATNPASCGQQPFPYFNAFAASNPTAFWQQPFRAIGCF